jgi:hypothetical protein
VPVLAARRPDLVRSLIVQEPPALELLVDAPARPAALLGLLARRPLMAVAVIRFGLGTMSPAARALARGDVDRALDGFCAGSLGRDGRRALPETRRQQMHDNAGTFQAHLTGALPRSADEVRRIDAPTLLVTGARTYPTLKRLMRELQRLLPHSESIEIAGAAHFADEDQPAAYTRAVLGFLARHRTAPARLGHVALAAAEPDALAALYSELLAWETVRRADNPLGGRLVALSGRPQEEDHELVLVGRPGGAHVAFRVARRGTPRGGGARARARARAPRSSAPSTSARPIASSCAIRRATRSSSTGPPVARTTTARARSTSNERADGWLKRHRRRHRHAGWTSALTRSSPRPESGG